ncbi:hypothetical protein [Roseomonas fluvialis]|nr:hypothetical protein [Roseomonas fluvialis]
MAQKERELSSERPMVAAKVREKVMGCDRGYPPAAGARLRNAPRIGSGWNCTVCVQRALQDVRHWPVR